MTETRTEVHDRFCSACNSRIDEGMSSLSHYCRDCDADLQEEYACHEEEEG